MTGHRTPTNDQRTAANREALLQALAQVVDVMATLRGPDGCPWDREQTHRSLLPYLVEEAHELVEAVEDDAGDGPMREELGDVLLQVLFHAQIASERGAFDLGDVATGLADKLRSRHPHVFGGNDAPRYDSAQAVREAWHAGKMQTRQSAMEGLPRGLPALRLAKLASQRAASSGFEWTRQEEIMERAESELREFEEACATRDALMPDAPHTGEALPAGPMRPIDVPTPESGRHQERTPLHAALAHEEMELGDMLFAVVQLARWRGLDPESALRRATHKFMARFTWMETHLREQGLPPAEQSSAQWWALWAQAKTHTGEDHH